MAEFSYSLETNPALNGADIMIGDNRIRERHDLAIVSVATPRGGEEALRTAIKAGWGLDLPGPRLSSFAGETRAIQTATDQLLLVFPHATPDAEPVVQAKLSGEGYTTDQTDSWVVLEVSGPDVHAAMERLSPVDLSPEAFPENASARTLMEHLGVLTVRTGPKRLWLMSASSSAASFLDAVVRSLENVQT